MEKEDLKEIVKDIRELEEARAEFKYIKKQILDLTNNKFLNIFLLYLDKMLENLYEKAIDYEYKKIFNKKRGL